MSRATVVLLLLGCLSRIAPLFALFGSKHLTTSPAAMVAALHAAFSLYLGRGPRVLRWVRLTPGLVKRKTRVRRR